MSGENNRATPPTEGTSTDVEKKKDTTQEAPAVNPEAEAVPAPAAAAPEATEESDRPAEASASKPTEPTDEKKPDVEMADDTAPAEAAPKRVEAAEVAKPEPTEQTTADTADAAAPDADASKSKRKSIGGGGGGGGSKAKKLNKKASKPRLLHLDAKPGDHYFVKLKGFPQWPVIICDEDMLPASLLKTRPVTAMRADGTYREDYADGGKNVADRTFPVMYLHTNEFGWVPNTELIELDPATVLQDVKLEKMRKSLQVAHQLAAENHSLDYYKELLQNYQEELIQAEKEKAAKAATPKGKKAKAASEEDDDIDMADAPDVGETPAKDKKAKKRKADESAETPQRSDSVKKPKIKLTTSATPKAANGATSTPKSAKTAEAKGAKPKSKKAKESEAKDEEEVTAPKEPEMSSAERHSRKKKEVLFLRHKLQKGLLTRDHEPKEQEMKLMSDYVTKLEAFPDLEVSIIRETKINKVLKAILKLENIPKEDEFKFKPRSQVLLDKWNKLLAVDGTPAAPAAEVNGTSKGAEKANGAKETGETDEPGKDKEEDKGEEKESEKEQKEDAKEPKEVSNGGSKEAPKPSEASEPSEEPAAEEAKAAQTEGVAALA